MHKKYDSAASKSSETSDILYGSETAKALSNFTISKLKMPRAFISALATIKSACAQANQELGLLDAEKSAAIQMAAKEIADGFHVDQFPVDVFQTGSGTSTNMNVNEVIASLAKQHSQQKISLHPNDDVNMGQSSNDVIPSSIHLSAAKLISEELLPSLQHLRHTLDAKASEHINTIKTGRTHLMDAMPLSLAQEISGWSSQIRCNLCEAFARGCLFQAHDCVPLRLLLVKPAQQFIFLTLFQIDPVIGRCTDGLEIILLPDKYIGHDEARGRKDLTSSCQSSQIWHLVYQ